MKRDMDLVRSMLLDIEAGKMTGTYNAMVGRQEDNGGQEMAALLFHGRLIIDAGFAHPTDAQIWSNVPYELTWAGCDFLDTIRDDAVWTKTKAGASKAAGAGFGFIVELAKGYAKAELTKLGLPLS